MQPFLHLAVNPSSRHSLSPPVIEMNAVTWQLFVVALSFFMVGHAAAAPPPPRASFESPLKAQEGLHWQELRPDQQATLKPLELKWASMELASKREWMELSQRFPSLSAAEKIRVQERMVEWAKLSPRERGQARLNYRDARLVPAPHRQARWETYQALPPQERLALSARAQAAAASNPKEKGSASIGALSRQSRQREDRLLQPLETPQLKSSLVPNPSHLGQPEFVAPAIVRAAPGATTTLISKRPTPPVHQQIGQPKIAATPQFVNSATLLPRLGPQATAASAAVPAPPPPLPPAPPHQLHINE